eukprot:5164859-Amphidinium_carterae.1
MSTGMRKFSAAYEGGGCLLELGAMRHSLTPDVAGKALFQESSDSRSSLCPFKLPTLLCEDGVRRSWKRMSFRALSTAKLEMPLKSTACHKGAAFAAGGDFQDSDNYAQES